MRIFSYICMNDKKLLQMHNEIHTDLILNILHKTELLNIYFKFVL